jgi:hypothetical protein
MTTSQIETVQDDFAAGEVTGVAPHLLPPNGLLRVRNGLLNEDGSTFKRGGSVYKSTSAFGTAGITGLWDVYLNPGHRTVFASPNDFAVLDPADDESRINLGSDGLPKPKPAAVLADILFIGGGYLYGGSLKSANFSTAGSNTHVTNGSKIVTDADGGFTANVDAGMLFQRGTERVYVVASVDSDTQVTLRDAYEGATATTINPVFYKLYKIAAGDPYPDGEFYCVAANRLITAQEAVLKFSEIDNPHKWTLSTVNPDHSVTETPNEHTLPEGGRILGAAFTDTLLLIFTTHGAFVLEGIALDIVDAVGSNQHRLAVHARDLILWEPQGIANWERLLIVPAINGIFLVDGVSAPVRLSRNIDSSLRVLVESSYHPGQAAVHNSHYFLPIAKDVNGAVVETAVCRLDRAALDRRRKTTFPWCILDGHGGSQAVFATRVGDATRDPLLLSGDSGAASRINDCTDFFTPSSITKLDADDSVALFEIVTRDFETGGGTLNRVRSVLPRYEMQDASADDPILHIGYALGSPAPEGPLLGDPAGLLGTGFGPPKSIDGSLWPFTSSGEIEFFETTCQFHADPRGTGRHRCRINKQARYIRYRIWCQDPVAKLVIRSLTTVVAPSLAARR